MSSFVTLLTPNTASAADAPTPLTNDAMGTDQATAAVAAAFGAALVTASQKLHAETEPEQGVSSAPEAEGEAVLDGGAPAAGVPVDLQTPPSVSVTLQQWLGPHGAVAPGVSEPRMPEGRDPSVVSMAPRTQTIVPGRCEGAPEAIDDEAAPQAAGPHVESDEALEGQGAARLARPVPTEGPTPAELVAQFVARASARGQAAQAALSSQPVSSVTQAAITPSEERPEGAEDVMLPDAAQGQAVTLAGLQAPPTQAARELPAEDDVAEQNLESSMPSRIPQSADVARDDEPADRAVREREPMDVLGWAQATAAVPFSPQSDAPEPEQSAAPDGAEPAPAPRVATSQAQPLTAGTEPAVSPGRDRHERVADDAARPSGDTEQTALEGTESDRETSSESAAAAEGQNFHAALNHAQAPQPSVAAASPVAQPIQVAQVSQELGAVISQGARRVQLRVSPEGLGELDVQIRMHQGEVHLTIRGDAPELAQALSQQVQGLRQDLDQQGLTLGTMDFGTLTSHTPTQQGDGGREFDAQGQRTTPEDAGLRRIVGEGAVRPQPAPAPAGRALGTRVIDVIL